MRWTAMSVCVAAAFATVGCGQQSERKAEAAAASRDASRPDPRLPAGFPIYLGAGGEARAFEIMPMRGGDGSIATFSVRATPADVIGFYERTSTAAGMTYAGRYDADNQKSYEARRQGEGRPRTFGVVAQSKGEWTNVTLNFDVTR